MTILFYRRALATKPSSPVDLPPGVTARIWRPSEQGLSGAGAALLQNTVWWAFDKVAILADHAFAEISLWRDGSMAHRLVVTPRWYRFPFMGRGDLQIGDVLTVPECRGQGLAGMAIRLAQRYAVAQGARHVWYLVEAENTASIRLIESCGYQLFAAGARTRPFGIAALGRFRIGAPSVAVGGNVKT